MRRLGWGALAVAIACSVGCGGDAFVFAGDGGDELAAADVGAGGADVLEDVQRTPGDELATDVIDAGDELAAADVGTGGADVLEDVQNDARGDELATDVVDAGVPLVDASADAVDEGPPLTCVSGSVCSGPRPVQCVYGSSYECCPGPCPK